MFVKKNAFCLLVIFIPILSFSQNSYIQFTKDWAVSQSDEETYYTCDCTFKYGEILDGSFLCYTPDDILVREYNFVDNVLDGKVYEYHESGQLKVSAEYNLGMPIGEWKEWDEDGELIVHQTFDESNSQIANYFQADKKYNPDVEVTKPSEPVIYGTECLLLRIDEQQYECSDEMLAAWYRVPPIPPDYVESGIYSGDTLIVTIKYLVNTKGKVEETELVQSCGDDFLDDLAVVHIENMLPFEAAKRYGKPVGTVMVADVRFEF